MKRFLVSIFTCFCALILLSTSKYSVTLATVVDHGRTSSEIFTDLFSIFFGGDSEINLDHIPKMDNPIPNTPGAQVTSTSNLTLPPAQSYPGCPDASTRLHVAGRYRHLNRRLPCDRPRMLVVHWSAGWSSAQATFDVLNNRDRSCQFAIDENEIIQMLDLYPNAVERGWCAGGDANVGSINFEITGAWFDDVLDQPNTIKHNRLNIMTEKTVDLACKLIRMYNIPKTAIYGHYQLQNGKQDAGVEYLKFFKQRVNERC